MKIDQKNIVSFYDQFANEEQDTEINSRHLSILDKVKSAGLNANDSVLEVGCGTGAFSHLLANQVMQGEVLALDISTEVIKKARKLWENQKNLQFETSDMLDFDLPGKTFDFFVFPDVLEHIPLDQYQKIFRSVYKHSHQDSVILIHIPAPRHLKWMVKNEPQRLQVIDPPLGSGDLIKSINSNGFYLDKMETYSIYFEEKDYQYFVFRAIKPLERPTPRSKWEILKDRISIRLKHGIIT